MPTAVIRRRDDDGRLVVGVPISNRPDHHAWLDEADHARLLNDYGNRPWFVNDNGSGKLYVRLRGRDRENLVMVARAVVSDPKAKQVRHRDGDTLNLRARNLEVCRPAQRLSRRSPISEVVKDASPRPAELLHVSRR